MAPKRLDDEELALVVAAAAEAYLTLVLTNNMRYRPVMNETQQVDWSNCVAVRDDVGDDDDGWWCLWW